MTTRIGEFNPVNLLAGEMYRSTRAVTLAAGQLYPAGAVIALNSDSEGVLVDSAGDAPDVWGVLVGEVDATGQATAGAAYLTGEFNRNMLTFGGTDTWETHLDAAREKGLFFLDTEQIPD